MAVSEQIKTILEFRGYIRTKLGEPKMRVELADSQIDTCLYDAMQLFREYSTGRGNARSYLVLDLIMGQQDYQLPEYIMQIGYDKTSQSVSAWVLAQLSGYAASDVLSLKSFDMVSFYMLQQWIHYLKYITISKFRLSFNTNTKILHVVPSPDDSITKIFIEVFHQASTDELLNERFVREYTLALCKIQLGEIRSKFQSLPGFNNSVSLNGETLKTEGQAEKEKLDDDLKLHFQWSQPPFPVFRSVD
jgi:hypothetical protein